MNSKRTVLITGCSDGSLGSALAIAFHEAGLHVYATARNPDKMTKLAALGIETLTLDVLSESSISDCVSKLSSLDILVNNAGAGYNMPVADMSIPEAKKLFDLNVWSYIAMTQAFLPLLLKSSKPMIVNHTSVSSVTVLPFQAAYSASKAAMAMLSDGLRLELASFGVTVVEVKSGIVKSNFIGLMKEPTRLALPEGSIYEPARTAIEKALAQESFVEAGMPNEEWARLVARDLLKTRPPPVIWRGENAFLSRVAAHLPTGAVDGPVKRMSGLDAVEAMLRK